MKYRNHLTQKPDRPLVVAPRRSVGVQDQPSAPPTPTTHEPLIDVNDRPSVLENSKEALLATLAAILALAGPLVSRIGRTTRRGLTAAHSYLSQQVRTIQKNKTLPKPRVRTLALLGGVLVVSLGAWMMLRQDSPAVVTSGGDTSDEKILGNQKPEFDTILPQGKSIESLGGWSRVSPPDRDPTFAYVDLLDDKDISVSQQLVPSAISDDPAGGVQSVAYDFNAKDRSVASDGTIFYIGTSSKGPQSIIFIKNDLLILIKSSASIDKQIWSEYIASLQ